MGNVLLLRNNTAPLALPPPSTYNYFGVNALDYGDVTAYGSTEQPFLNLLKQAGSNYSYKNVPWWTRSNTGTDTNEELTVLSANLDSDGYATTLSGLTATYIETWMNINIIADTPLPGAPNSGNALYPAAAAAVTYRLQFQGKCTGIITNATGMASSTPGVTISGNQFTSTNAWGTTNTVTFTLTNSFRLQITALPDASNYFKAASIVDNSLAASYDAGEILHPYFKSFMTGAGAAHGFSRLRTMTGLATNSQDINLMFSATLNAGATSGTLTSATNGSVSGATWSLPSGTYQVVFGNAGADVRACTFTYGSSSVTWSGGLGTSCSTTSPSGARNAMACAALYTWPTRPLPSNMTWNCYGLPFEVCIQACNELGIDLWLNIPVTAQLVDISTVFINNIARLLYNGTGANLTNWNVSTFTGLSPSLTVYVENGNEVSGSWNGGAGYAQGANALLIGAVAQGLYAANSNNLGYTTSEYYGVMVANICDQFDAVFGTLVPRVNVTCMTQFALGNGIVFLNQAMNTPHAPGRAYTHGIGSWGFAPYMPLANGFASMNTTDATYFFALSSAAQVNEVFSLCYTNVAVSGHTYSSFPSDGWVGDVIGGNGAAGMLSAVSSQPWASLPVTCYEMGINADTRAGIPNASYTTAQYTAMITAVLRDSRIAYVYYDPQKVLSTNPGYLQAMLNMSITGNHLNGVAPTTAAASYAGWGLIEEIMQMAGIPPLSTVPRYSGAINFINIASEAVTNWFGATLPTLPTEFTTTSAPPPPANTNRGSYYTPGVGGDSGLTFQSALNSAAAATGSKGDVIVLQAGTAYSASQYTLPTRSGSGWIYIISSQAPEIGGASLPVAGVRVGPSNLSAMPNLRSSTSGVPLIIKSTSAQYYRFVGIDMELTDSNGICNYVIRLDSSDSSLSTIAQHITFDRCIIDGAPSYGVTHAMNIDGSYIEVTECYFGDHVFSVGDADCQNWYAYNSPGPYRINNNRGHAGGQQILFGGTDSIISGVIPSDLQFTNNSLSHNIWIGTLTCSTSSANVTINTNTSGTLRISMALYNSAGSEIGVINSGSGNSWVLTANASVNVTSAAATGLEGGKDMIEMKCVQRALIGNNYVMNPGGAGQQFSNLLTVRNQSGGNPQNTVSDLTVQNNVFLNCVFSAWNILLQDGPADQGVASTQPCYRQLYKNNLWLFLNEVIAGNVQTAIQIDTNPVSPNPAGLGGHVVFDHNTMIFTGSNEARILSMVNTAAGGGPTPAAMNNIVWSNNIFDKTSDEIAFGGFSGAVTPNVSQAVFINNVINQGTQTYPTGNFKPASTAAIGFTSYGSTTTAAGYALTSGSTYHAKGVSGSGQTYTGTGVIDGTDIGCNISLLPTS